MSEILRIKSRLKDYEVCFIDNFASSLKSYVQTTSFLVIDRYFLKAHGGLARDIFGKNRVFSIDPSERNKTIEYCNALLKQFIANDVRKDSMVVAVGGGITQDIAAFISSILFRGMDWVFYPTTLLAQADSCIGGKSSINVEGYKNLVGTFFPPSRVFIDASFLETLSVDAIKSGIGEMLHFYMLEGSRVAAALMDDYESVFLSRRRLKKYIVSSLEIKKRFIEIDEFDKKERNLLNYGHTFGHARESVSGYAVNHGQAVTEGMDIANYISMRLGYMNAATFEAMHELLRKNMPDFKIDDKSIADYLKALSKDKKNAGRDLICILASGWGAMQKVKIPLDESLKDTILDYFKANIPAIKRSNI